jgi:signal transduction histidine kinase
VNVELHVDGEFDLQDRYRTCVYRTVQEALTNCVRHARACSIDVNMTSDGDHLDVSVTDDGIGLESPRRGSGLGLRGIEERVKGLRGVMTIGN